MSDLNNAYGDFLPYLNNFKLKNRPLLNLGNVVGEDGNVNHILANFSNAMKSQGYYEESKYWGNNVFLFNVMRLKELKMNYDTMFKIIVSMTNTNVELMLKAENDIETTDKYKEYNNTYLTEGTNCFGRTEIFYSLVEPKNGGRNLRDVINDNGYEILLSKDNLGMTAFDHYLLADKKRAYVLGMQYLAVNAEPDEIKQILDNSIFDYNCHEKIAKNKNITMAFYYALLKATVEPSEEDKYIDDYVKFIVKSIGKVERSFEEKNKYSYSNSKSPSKSKVLSEIFVNVLENINDIKGLGDYNVLYKKIIMKMEDRLESNLVEFKSISPELKAMLEQKTLMKLTEENSLNNIITKKRRL